MIYTPEEDTYLIAKHLKIFSKGKDVLDMGTGSGYLAKVAIGSGAKSITAIDINEKAIEKLKEEKLKNIKLIHSNLFEKIKSKFDLIVFNPPYLPFDKKEDKESRVATTGGKKGDEIILKFLKQSKKHLNDKGIILLLLSSLTPRDRIEKTLKSLNFKSDLLSKKEIFFESLEVYKIEKH